MHAAAAPRRCRRRSIESKSKVKAKAKQWQSKSKSKLKPKTAESESGWRSARQLMELPQDGTALGPPMTARIFPR